MGCTPPVVEIVPASSFWIMMGEAFGVDIEPLTLSDFQLTKSSPL